MDGLRCRDVGGYLAVLLVTVVATRMTVGAALSDSNLPEQKAEAAITIAVLAAIVVAAIIAFCLRHTDWPANYWALLLALIAAIALPLVVVVVAFEGTTEAVAYWRDYGGRGYAGDAGNNEFRLAERLAFVCPFVAVALSGFQRGAARLFLTATALTSFAWLAMLAFDSVARNTLRGGRG